MISEEDKIMMETLIGGVYQLYLDVKMIQTRKIVT
tara:strand:+ start:709 stop:813 length:105 start_codon:yes stop_codon:yes gene_type:complete